MTNPATEFLMSKQALGMPNLRPALSAAGGIARQSAGVLGGALAAGAGAAAFAGLAGAAGKAFNAATKARDFRAMMEANPDLHEYHERDPASFNRMYTSLRTLAPDYAKEPLVAGHFMRQAAESPIEGRGGVMVQAQNAAKPPRMGPLSEAAIQGFAKGFGAKPESPKPRQLIGQRKEVYNPGEDSVSRVEYTENTYG